MEKEKFVPLPNRVFAFDTNYYLNDDEFLVYYYLFFLVTARDTNVSIVNIELLNFYTEFDRGNPSRGKKRIGEALMGLHRKCYIKLIHSDDKLRYNTTLKVNLPVLSDPIYESIVESDSLKFRGFTMVKHDMVNRASTIKQLKVQIYVSWRSFANVDDAPEFAIPYSQWEKVLRVSYATAVKIINSCVEDGLITKYRGQYYKTLDGDIRQETNRYSLNEKEELSAGEVIKDIITELNVCSIKDQSIEKRSHRWFNTGSNDSKLIVDDFIILLSTNCNVLKNHAKKRIDAIVDSGEDGKKMIDSFFEKAQKKLLQSGLENRADSEEYWEYTDYRKGEYIAGKKADYDISEYLDDEPESVDDSELLNIFG